MLRVLTACLVVGTPLHALAEGEIPAKMQGRYASAVSTAVGAVAIELVSMESSDKAKVKVKIDPAVNFHGAPCYLGTVETVAAKANGAWTLTVGKSSCATYTIVLRPVEGKQAFEGQYTNDVGGQGNVSLEY